MIYVLIVILILVIFLEFLIIRKGLRSGKRTASYLQQRGDAHTPESLSYQQAANDFPTSDGTEISENQPPPPPDSEVAPEEFADDAESKNVVPFTPKPGQTAGAAAEIQQEIRQKESLPQEEPSVLDIIQEIRGKTLPAAEQTDTPPDTTETTEDETEAAQPAEPQTSSAETQPEDQKHDEPGIAIEQTSRPGDTPPDETDEDPLKTGLELIRQGKLDEGITQLQTLTQATPERAEVYFNLGIAYTLKDFVPRAITAYQRTLALNPEYGKACFNLGTLYLRQGNLPEAIKQLERATTLQPDSMKALWNLYEAYRSQGQFHPALKTLQRLIELEPEDASLYNHVGICHARLAEYQKAIAAWQHSISLGASSHLLYYNLGKTHELLGNIEEASDHYRRFLDLTADMPDQQEFVIEVQSRLANLEPRTASPSADDQSPPPDQIPPEAQ